MKLAKFTSHRFEIDQDYELAQRIIFQGEAEIGASNEKPNGDGTTNLVFSLIPLTLELRGLKGGITKTKETTQTQKRSRSQQHRAVLYKYWSQQLSGKHTFDSFYQAYYDKRDQEIKDKLN